MLIVLLGFKPDSGQSRSSFVTHISPQILNISNKPCVFAQLDRQSPKLMVSFSGALKYPHTDGPISCLRARKKSVGRVSL